MMLSLSLIACGGSSKTVEQKSGKLLSSTLVANHAKNAVRVNGVNAKYAVNVYRIIYETKNQQGNYIRASGLLIIPQKGAQAKSPTLLYHHGTQYENRQAPSVNIYNASNHVLPAYIGFITVAPDYIGYGESLNEQHPYLITKLTASASIDMLRASHAFLKQENILSNKQLFLGGYSQGGAATLASQKMLEEEFANEFTVTASSAGAGSYAPSDDLIQTSQDILDNYDSYQFKRLSNIGLIFKSMDSVYSLNMMDRIFQPDYVADSGFIVVFLFIYYLLLKLLIF
jgi:pimeloyl-ACP methyl ester carboxylesterase